MAKYTGKKGVSEETRNEALQLAKGTQVPGQTKAHTKLIAQGIERGIDLYKKQHKEKARALDRRQRELSRKSGAEEDASGTDTASSPVPTSAPRRQWLPWLLLGLTWAGVLAYWTLNSLGRLPLG